MSTAGKVLCCLIAIPALAWIWLASGLAELNRQYGKQVVALDESIKADVVALETTREEVARGKSSIDLVQRQRDSELTVRRGQMAQLFHSESMSKETQDRYALQFASITASNEAAERRVTRAEADLAEARANLETAKAELTTIKEEHQRQRAQLDALWKQFQTLLAENAELARQSLKAEQARGTSGGAVRTLAR